MYGESQHERRLVVAPAQRERCLCPGHLLFYDCRASIGAHPHHQSGGERQAARILRERADRRCCVVLRLLLSHNKSDISKMAAMLHQ